MQIPRHARVSVIVLAGAVKRAANAKATPRALLAARTVDTPDDTANTPNTAARRLGVLGVCATTPALHSSALLLTLLSPSQQAATTSSPAAFAPLPPTRPACLPSLPTDLYLLQLNCLLVCNCTPRYLSTVLQTQTRPPREQSPRRLPPSACLWRLHGASHLSVPFSSSAASLACFGRDTDLQCRNIKFDLPSSTCHNTSSAQPAKAFSLVHLHKHTHHSSICLQ